MRFLLAAVIIQDIGLPLDSNHSGDMVILNQHKHFQLNLLTL